MRATMGGSECVAILWTSIFFERRFGIELNLMNNDYVILFIWFVGAFSIVFIFLWYCLENESSIISSYWYIHLLLVMCEINILIFWGFSDNMTCELIYVDNKLSYIALTVSRIRAWDQLEFVKHRDPIQAKSRSTTKIRI